MELACTNHIHGHQGLCLQDPAAWLHSSAMVLNLHQTQGLIVAHCNVLS